MRKAIHWAVVGTILLTACSAVPAQDGKGEERKKPAFEAGIVLSGEASAKSVGLSIMPGAVRREKADGESNNLTLALWGGEFGFKVAVLKLRTAEPIDQVASYYKSEMRRYGTVLDCASEMARTAPKEEKSKKPKEKGDDDKTLDCDGKPKRGGYVFKVGTSNNQRVVNLEVAGKQVNIDIVRVVATD